MGYLGVDVFFILSGYLITGIIIQAQLSGTFSIWHFYERRFRRIFPALFTVLLFCAVFTWKFYLPEEMEEFGRSLVAANIFLSNFFFWQEVDYF